MKFGIAKELITPSFPTAMGGYGSFYGKQFLGIHDDLYVRALLLDDGRSQLLFVTLDLLFHDFELTEQVKQYAHDKYGISLQGIFLSYTHTHGGPAVSGYGDPNQLSEPYEQFLRSRIECCIDRAMVNQFEGTILYGSVEGDWNINRRKPVNGTIELAPNPAGAKDNTLHLLQICDTAGAIKGIFVNYACHPVTVRDTLYLSGDFPGRICQLLECEYFGSTALFFQGAGANARPRLTAQGDQFVTLTYAEVNEMAGAITSRIKTAIATRPSFTSIELDLAAQQFQIPLQLDPFPKALFEQKASDPEEHPAIRTISKRVYDHYDETPDVLLVPGGIARISEGLYVAFMGGEPCYEVKLTLEPLFPGKQLLFIGYTDACAYLPSDKLNAEGGYEASGSTIEYGLKGPFKPGIDATMKESFLAAIASIESST